jgi:hypothetical protein
VKRRWIQHVHEIEGGLRSVTHQAMEQWLRDQILDPQTRDIRTAKAMKNLVEEANESFNTFQKRYDEVAAEWATLLSEDKQIAFMLSSLREQLYDRCHRLWACIVAFGDALSQ